MTEAELKTKSCPHITGPYEHQSYDPMTGAPRIDILVVSAGACIGSACAQYRETSGTPKEYLTGENNTIEVPGIPGISYCGLAGVPS